jgi:hypothetical protein
MHRAHGAAFIDEFFGFHNIVRFTTPEHKTGSEIYYNIPIVLGGFFPWSAFLPFGLWRMFKEKAKGPSVFILSWFFVIFTFFTVSSTKLPTYIFPCFISLALIVGRLWDDFLTRPEEKNISLGMKSSYYLLIAALTLAAAGGYIFIKADSPDLLSGAVVSALFMMLGMGLSLAAFIAKKFLAAFLFIAYSFAIILFPAASLVLPGVEGYESSRPVSKIIMKHYKKGDAVGAEKDYRPGVAFYTDTYPELLWNDNNLLEAMKAGKTVWGVLKRRNIENHSSNIIYRYGKKCLFTNFKEGRKK